MVYGNLALKYMNLCNISESYINNRYGINWY